MNLFLQENLISQNVLCYSSMQSHLTKKDDEITKKYFVIKRQYKTRHHGGSNTNSRGEILVVRAVEVTNLP